MSTTTGALHAAQQDHRLVGPVHSLTVHLSRDMQLYAVAVARQLRTMYRHQGAGVYPRAGCCVMIMMMMMGAWKGIHAPGNVDLTQAGPVLGSQAVGSGLPTLGWCS